MIKDCRDIRLSGVFFVVILRKKRNIDFVLNIFNNSIDWVQYINYLKLITINVLICARCEKNIDVLI